MTKPNVDLADPVLSVAPGGRVTTKLTIRPAAKVVGQYRISIPSHCPASKWVSFRFASDTSGRSSPSAKVSFLRAGKTVELEVAFEPPVGFSTPGGDSPYIVAIDAQEPENESTAVQGMLHVGGQPAIISKLFEKSDRGRRKGHFRVGVANSGNTPIRVRLSSDHDPSATAVAWVPEELALGPRSKSEFLIEVLARNMKPTGKAQTHKAEFTPRATTPAGDLPGSTTHAATFEQRPMVPTFAVPFLALAVAAGGFFAFQKIPGPNSDITIPPPNVPEELQATAALDSVKVRWRNDERAAGAEIAFIDCEDRDATEVKDAAEVKPVEEKVAEVEFDLGPDAPELLCFRARSKGSEENFSIWSDTVDTTRADSTVPIPQNLFLEGDELHFDLVPGAQEYELIVNNNGIDKWDASPINLRDLELASGDTVAVKAVIEDRYSAPSQPINYSSTSQPLFDRPWILFSHGNNEPTEGPMTGVRATVGRMPEPFRNRRQNVDSYQLPQETTDGGIFRSTEKQGSLDIGGRWVIADPGFNQLTEQEAIDFCRKFFENLKDPEDAGGLGCTAYGSNGLPLSGGG